MFKLKFSSCATAFLTSLLLAFCSSQLEAEYIAIKNTPAGKKFPTEAEFNQIYAVLMRYQFPMNTNPYVHPVVTSDELTQRLAGYKEGRFTGDRKSGATVLATISKGAGPITPLSDQEMAELGTNEEAYLRKKIKEINDDFDIVHMPTTLYELKSLEIFGKLPQAEILKREGDILKDLKPLTDLTKLCSNNGDLQLLWHVYLSQNYITAIRQIAYFINNHIDPTLVLPQHMVEQSDVAENVKNIFLSMYRSQDTRWFLEDVQGFSKFDRAGFELTALAVINKAIALDIEAHQNNKAILWRGTKAYARPLFRKTNYTIDEFQAKAEKKERQNFIDSTISEKLLLPKFRSQSMKELPVEANYYSNSYGNGLFSGRRDVGKAGAMPFQYSMRKSFIGYGLLIDKSEYLNTDSNVRKLFFITPLSTMVGLFARGELFHSRSRVALCTESVPSLGGLPSEFTHEFIPATTKNNFLAFTSTPQTPADHEIIFSNYLVENVRIIRNGSGKIDKYGRILKAPLTERVLQENQLKAPEEKFPMESKLLHCAEEK